MKEDILEFLTKIPEWKVVSYKYLWDKFKLHPRHIALILSSNINQEIFPCYKVVNSSWKIGWYNLWIEEKIIKLEKDWIKIKNWKIDKKYFLN